MQNRIPNFTYTSIYCDVTRVWRLKWGSYVTVIINSVIRIVGTWCNRPQIICNAFSMYSMHTFLAIMQFRGKTSDCEYRSYIYIYILVRRQPQLRIMLPINTFSSFIHGPQRYHNIHKKSTSLETKLALIFNINEFAHLGRIWKSS